ncbi:MAG: hypothetical protein WBM42_06915, partial [Eudoraea sp.]
VTQTITVDSIEITTQPSDQNVFVGNNAIFAVNTSNADTYQWQLSTNGGSSFSNISDGSEYLGTSTTSLTILAPEIVKNGYLYRVLVSNSGATCPQVTSNSAILNVRVATVITNRKITFRVNKS